MREARKRFVETEVGTRHELTYSYGGIAFIWPEKAEAVRMVTLSALDGSVPVLDTTNGGGWSRERLLIPIPQEVEWDLEPFTVWCRSFLGDIPMMGRPTRVLLLEAPDNDKPLEEFKGDEVVQGSMMLLADADEVYIFREDKAVAWKHRDKFQEDVHVAVQRRT